MLGAVHGVSLTSLEQSPEPDRRQHNIYDSPGMKAFRAAATMSGLSGVEISSMLSKRLRDGDDTCARPQCRIGVGVSISSCATDSN